MNRKRTTISLLILFILGVFCFWGVRSFHEAESDKNVEHIKYSLGPYFIPINISKFTASNQPCFPVKIEGHSVSVMLDLGFRGHFSFTTEFLKTIEKKTYIQSTKMYGLRGSEYVENLFQIPKIIAGSIFFANSEVHEHTDSSHVDANLRKVSNECSKREPGIIGWEVFQNTNLLLDLKNSKIAFCDSLSTLGCEGYKVEEFVKVPLLIDRGLIECEVEIAGKLVRCMLDTGATINILNTDKNEMNLDNAERCESFVIGSRDFGPIDFYSVPIRMPIQIDAMLGMDFFEEHCVFIDFSEDCIYFRKHSE